MTDDTTDTRLADLEARGIEPHAFLPGILRKRRTVCLDCFGYDSDPQHDPDLPRPRR